MSAFLNLSRPAFLGLATALETGRLSSPFSVSSVAIYVPASQVQAIVEELEKLRAMGATNDHIAYTLRLLSAEREASQEMRDRVDLVWTGPEIAGAESRDTRAVVRELFATAHRSVLISSFAIDKGRKARELFGELAERMEAHPDLQVRMFLNVKRPYKSQVSEPILLREFADSFRREIWPGPRLPEVFYDPRSLAVGTASKACLHAKCVVVDDERVFITSANFTQAARDRNIEAGILLPDPLLARAMRSQFESLVVKNILRRILGIE